MNWPKKVTAFVDMIVNSFDQYCGLDIRMDWLSRGLRFSKKSRVCRPEPASSSFPVAAAT
ncbi:hypothetical protein [Roseovarius marisflavi]|uniref:hypothetical protein n=1 Tax=Roseovarius marisflavi TaxID=1054996 RepID=UPI001C65A625|nr:hypothetical protein [Roseovarius marisflavi]